MKKIMKRLIKEVKDELAHRKKPGRRISRARPFLAFLVLHEAGQVLFGLLRKLSDVLAKRNEMIETDSSTSSSSSEYIEMSAGMSELEQMGPETSDHQQVQKLAIAEEMGETNDHQQRVDVAGPGAEDLEYSTENSTVTENSTTLQQAAIVQVQRNLVKSLQQAATLLCTYQPKGLYDVQLFSGFSVDMKTLRGFPLDTFAHSLNISVNHELVKAAKLSPGGPKEKDLQNMVVRELSNRKQLKVNTHDLPPGNRGSTLQRIMATMDACLASRGLSMPNWRHEWQNIHTFHEAIGVLASEFVQACVAANLDASILKDMALQVVESIKVLQLK